MYYIIFMLLYNSSYFIYARHSLWLALTLKCLTCILLVRWPSCRFFVSFSSMVPRWVFVSKKKSWHSSLVTVQPQYVFLASFECHIITAIGILSNQYCIIDTHALPVITSYALVSKPLANRSIFFFSVHSKHRRTTRLVRSCVERVVLRVIALVWRSRYMWRQHWKAKDWYFFPLTAVDWQDLASSSFKALQLQELNFEREDPGRHLMQTAHWKFSFDDVFLSLFEVILVRYLLSVSWNLIWIHCGGISEPQISFLDPDMGINVLVLTEAQSALKERSLLSFRVSYLSIYLSIWGNPICTEPPSPSCSLVFLPCFLC
jgi:hypothetical protein